MPAPSAKALSSLEKSLSRHEEAWIGSVTRVHSETCKGGLTFITATGELNLLLSRELATLADLIGDSLDLHDADQEPA